MECRIECVDGAILNRQPLIHMTIYRAIKHQALRGSAAPLAVLLGFALLGSMTFFITRAATVVVPVEAELGMLAGSASYVSSAGASTAAGNSNNAVRFGSGLLFSAGAWSSGVASDDLSSFATYRGRPLDNTGTWPNRETWEIISNPDIYGAVTALAAYRQIWIGLAMLPEQQTADFASCASGAYDQYFRTYGTNLTKLNRGNAIIRLGWEANGDWFKWSIANDPTNYKACFRREVAALRSTAPNVKLDWNMNKDSHMGSASIASAYPGDDVVDIVGVDFYDNYPAYPDKAAWDADYNATQNGGPLGIGSWLAFAKQHGKKLSVPEWGIHSSAGAGADDAYYIQSMYDFFTLTPRILHTRHTLILMMPHSLFIRPVLIHFLRQNISSSGLIRLDRKYSEKENCMSAVG